MDHDFVLKPDWFSSKIWSPCTWKAWRDLTWSGAKSATPQRSEIVSNLGATARDGRNEVMTWWLGVPVPSYYLLNSYLDGLLMGHSSKYTQVFPASRVWLPQGSQLSDSTGHFKDSEVTAQWLSVVHDDGSEFAVAPAIWLEENLE